MGMLFEHPKVRSIFQVFFQYNTSKIKGRIVTRPFNHMNYKKISASNPVLTPFESVVFFNRTL